MPSGYRSKGFKLTKQFYIDFCHYLKQFVGNADINVIKTRFTSDRLIKFINLYMPIYFGAECNDELRKEMFGYGSLNSIGETLEIETLKEKNVARCIEKAAGYNGLANFMGIDCSFVLSNATVEEETKGHAYCLIKENEKYKICDSSFFSSYGDGTHSIPFIFDLDTNMDDKRITFDSGKLGAINPIIIEYDFPWNKFKTNDTDKNVEKTQEELKSENMQLRKENLELKERFFKVRKFVIDRCSKIPFVGKWILSEISNELGENELNSGDEQDI